MEASDYRAPAGSTSTRLDHLLVGAGDLEAGRAEIERLTGVRPAVGGSHPQWGSHNALLALGPACYLELVALRPEAPARGPFGLLRDLERVTAIGWAVATKSTDSTRAALERAGLALTPSIAGERQTPEGHRLAWTTFGIADRPMVGTLPFFIEWSAGVVHPATSSPAGCSLRALRLADPESERLESLCNVLGLAEAIEIERARTPKVEITLNTPKGCVKLGG